MPPTHVEVPHETPDAKYSHDPVPLQAPVLPQVEGLSAAQASKGSEPDTTGEQVPYRPGCTHELHPVQTLLQQTPCWQRPFAHSAPLAQLEPSAFSEQTFALHE